MNSVFAMTSIPPQQPTSPSTEPPGSRYQDSGSSGGSNTPLYLLLALLLIGVVVLATVLISGKDDNKKPATNSASTAKSGDSSKEAWQSVFLTNGQVYFGHIAKESGEKLVLKDVYYLQVQEPIQPPKDGQQPQGQPSLAKLGRFELHCPVDEMQINTEQVLFYEELRPKSKVVDAITRYLETDDVTKECYDGAPAPAPAPAPQTQNTQAPTTAAAAPATTTKR